MKTTQSELIDNSEVELSMCLVRDVDCIKTITTEASAFDDFIIKFRLDINDYSKLSDIYKLSNITFFDWVGFGKEFKQVFDVFRRYTEFSKEEISHKLRNATTCNFLNSEQIGFMFLIKPSKLIKCNYTF